jgi:hypothetical protein
MTTRKAKTKAKAGPPPAAKDDELSLTVTTVFQGRAIYWWGDEDFLH